MKITLRLPRIRSLLLQCLGSRSARVAVQRAVPLLYTVPAFLCGQHLALLIPEGKSIFFFVLFLIFLLTLKKKFWLFALGVVSVLPTLWPEPLPVAGTQKILLEVVSDPFYGRNEEVSFIARVLALHPGAPDTPGWVGSRVACKTAHLPWVNSAELYSGAYIWALTQITPRAGDRIPPTGRAARMQRQGIAGNCAIKALTTPLNTEKPQPGYRQQLMARVQATVGDSEGMSMLLGMTLGVKGLLSRKTEAAFRNTGIAHLLVVSGYHFGVLYSFCALFLAPLVYALPVTRRFFGKRYLRILILILLACYCALVGGAIATSRALIAASLVCAGFMSERRISLTNSILFAALMVACVWPGSLYDPGTQYTFAALCAIACAIADKQSLLPVWVRVPLYATAATTCVTLCWFQTFSSVAFFANCFVAPLVTLLICNLGVLGLLLLIVYEPAGVWLLRIVEWYAYLIRDFIWWLAEFPGSDQECTAFTATLLCGCIVLFFLQRIKGISIIYLMWRGCFPYRSLYAMHKTRIDL